MIRFALCSLMFAAWPAVMLAADAPVVPPKPAPTPAPAILPAAPVIVGTKVAPYLIELKARNVPTGTAIIWDVHPAESIQKRVVKTEQACVIAGPAGTYKVLVRLVKGENVDELTTTVTLIGGAAPAPIPTPPGPTPKPVDPPKPDAPPPIAGAGLKVLIVYETGAIIPAAQGSILFGKTAREAMESKCAVGPDGATREYRIWDKDSDASGEAKTWRDAFARPRAGVPWLVVSDGKGAANSYEGPLPATVDGFMTILKKAGG